MEDTRQLEMRCDACRHQSWYRDGSSQAPLFGHIKIIDGELRVDQMNRWGRDRERDATGGPLREEQEQYQESLRREAERKGMDESERRSFFNRWMFRPRMRINSFIVTDTLRMRCRRGHEIRARPERLKKLVEQARDGVVWL